MRSIPALTGWLFLTFLAPAAGAWMTSSAWYADLVKPSWSPPGWLFGPVWTLIYVLMAVAAWLVWREGGWARQRRPLTLYIVQLVLNAAWTPIFFGLHQPGWALIEIVLLWVAIVATLLAFKPVRPLAAWLLAPYLAWVSFAAFLNFTLWRLN
jgi:tryptophan-rich sensory protein